VVRGEHVRNDPDDPRTAADALRLREESDARDRTDPRGDHVRKTRTDMPEKTRAIQDTVMEQGARQGQIIDGRVH
jgi:hypothetical protein